MSFLQIQGLVGEIRQVKNSHPHTKSQVPIILIGNKADIVGREVSLLEGEKIAQGLGYRFIEASAKDSGNIEYSFNAIIIQLRTLQRSQTLLMKETLLDDLINSLRKWYKLLDNLERVALSQIQLAETGTSTLVYTATEQPDLKNPSTSELLHVELSSLQLHRVVQRHQSSLSSQPPVSPKQRLSSISCNTPHSSVYPRRSMLEADYNSEVQKAFEDIFELL